jgi:hypothetical protein
MNATTNLTLSGTSSDCTPRHKISDELRGDGVEELATRRHAKFVHVQQELSCSLDALIDLERPIQLWVIDQTLPSYSCAWFLLIWSKQHRIWCMHACDVELVSSPIPNQACATDDNPHPHGTATNVAFTRSLDAQWN